jgi:hypothetical protein
MSRLNTMLHPQRRHSIGLLIAASIAFTLVIAGIAWAEPPSTSYIFPAGGQRGTKVQARVGGHYLHDRANFEMLGPGVRAPAVIERMETVWFEGPIVRLPASQRQEDYPQDYRAEIEIAADSPLGTRYWRAANSQGATPARRFVVGDLPEVVEQEVEGDPIPVAVAMPVTINGRIFPREDVDVWTIRPTAGRAVTCAVAAISLGSPLEARLEVRDPRGNRVAESTGERGGDPTLTFMPAEKGEYEVRIHDVRGEGLQPFVYRLTLTDGPWVNHVFPLGARRGVETTWSVQGVNLNAQSVGVASPMPTPSSTAANVPTVTKIAKVEAGEGEAFGTIHWQVESGRTNPWVVASDDLDEKLEQEPNDETAQANSFTAPAILNGRVEKASDKDRWTCVWKKGEEWLIESQSVRLGSALDPTLVVYNSEGREIAKSADGQGLDPVVRVKTPEDGEYTIVVADRFRTRGGAEHAYRLRVAPSMPAVRLEVLADTLTVDRGATGKLAVQVIREGGFKEPVTLAIEGLPAGVEAAEVVVAPNQNRGELVVKPAADARIGAARIRVIGKTNLDDKPVTLVAALQRKPSDSPWDPVLDQLLLAVAMPTPFKFQGSYEMTYIPCGAVSRKRFTIERNGYEGPLEVRLADKQNRHLQGVTGSVVTVPAGASEFVYPITLPPWMELGRTSRVVLMATGEVEDGQGSRHKVTFTSGDQNNQMVNLVSPSPLRIALDRATTSVTPGSSTKLKVQVRRDRSLQAPVRLELVTSAQLRDVTAKGTEIPADQEHGELELVFGATPGPFTMPLVIRATARRGDDPLVAEATLELVAAQ